MGFSNFSNFSNKMTDALKLMQKTSFQIPDSIRNLSRLTENLRPSIMDIAKEMQIPNMPHIPPNINPVAYSSYFTNPKLNEQLEEERELIDNLRVETLYHTQEIKNLLSCIENYQGSYDLVGSSIGFIKWMFFVGVVLPLCLSAIPCKTFSEYFKETPLWAIITMSVIGVVVITSISCIFITTFNKFKKVNDQMNFEAKDIEKLKHYSKLENYSPYFKNFVDNVRNTPEEKEISS